MADVKISTLRVSAELDASKYVAGAQQKTAADQQMAASGQNVSVSVTDTQVKISQAGDVVARLSRQYVDGYAAAQRMAQAHTQLANAVDRGKVNMQQAERILEGISAKYGLMADSSQFASRGQTEFAAALERSNAKLREQQFWHQEWLREFNKQPITRMQAAGNQNTLGAFGAFNTGQQLQDIAVTAAMGQSIPTIALQQGLQLGTALEIQLENAKRSGLSMAEALRGSFLGILSPINLIAIGLTAVAAAAIQFFVNSQNSAKGLTTAVENSSKAVKDLAEAYHLAGVNAEDLARKTQIAADASLRLSQSELRRQITSSAKEFETPGLLERLSAFGGGLPRQAVTGDAGFLAKQINEVREAAADGTLTFERLSKIQKEINSNFANMKSAGGEGLDLLKRWIGLDTTPLSETRDQVQELLSTIVDAQHQLERLEEIRRMHAKDNRLGFRGDEHDARLALRMGGDIEPNNAGIQELETQRAAAVTTAEIAQINARTIQERVAAVKQLEEARIVQNEKDWQREIRITTAVTLEAARAARELADARREREFGRQDLISGAQNELANVGKIGGAAAAARKEFELLQEVQDKVRRGEETQAWADKEAAAIHKTAAAYGELTDAIAKANLQQDLMFERRQIGRDSEDQAIASRLHAAGRPDDLNSTEASLIRTNLRLAEAKDDFKGFFQDVLSGFRDGKSAVEAFTNALSNLAGKLADRFLDRAMDELFGALTGTGGQSSTGGTGLGLIGKLLGLAGGSSGFPAAPATPPDLGNVFGGSGSGYGGGVANDDLGLQSYVKKRIDGAFNDIISGGGGSDTLAGFMGGDRLSGNMARYAAAIRFNESGSYAGNYSALGPITGSGDRAYGAYQVMGSNIPSWTQRWYGDRLSPSQFLHNPAAQDSVFKGEFGSYVDRWGPNRAANAWFTGSPTGGGRDVLGTSSTQYVEKFQKALEGAPASISKLSVGADSAAQSLVTASQGASHFGSLLSSFMGGGGASSGWFQGLSSLFGGASGALNYMMGISPGATGAILAGGALGPAGLYHEGGIAGYPGSSRYVSPSVFMGARRYHMGGLAGDEVPAILRRGEPVFRSMDHARQVVGANQNIPQLAAQVARLINVNLKNINVYDPSVVGDYQRTDEGEQATMNVLRRTGNGRGL